jgi:hypothetical protein
MGTSSPATGTHRLPRFARRNGRGSDHGFILNPDSIGRQVNGCSFGDALAQYGMVRTAMRAAARPRGSCFMPIRFRCRYCNQLLGIARRKAGMEVDCPTCHGRLTVPAASVAAPNGGRGAPAPLFEQSDFVDYLRPSPFAEEASRHAAASGSRGARPASDSPLLIDVERLPDEIVPSRRPAAGILLTPPRLTALVVAGILLLAGAFAAGIAVDRLFLIKPVP